MTSGEPQLAGRRILVMGLGSAASQAIAGHLATAGAQLALTTSTTEAEEAYNLRRFARKLNQAGSEGIIESVIDMSLATSVQVAIRQVSKELGGLDALVVAPEVRLQKPAERISDSEWARALNGNLSAAFYACRGVAREIMAREDTMIAGQIVVVTSRPLPIGEAGFAAAQGGIAALVRSLAAEWQESQLHVNLLELRDTSDEALATEAAQKAVELMSAPISITGQTLEIG